jgi:hypothetical protein
MQTANGSCIPLVSAAGQIVHGDVEKDIPAGCFNSQNHCFGIVAATESLFIHVDFRGENLESETLVVEKGDGISDDHVREFANGFTYNLIARGNLRPCKLTCNSNGNFGSKIQNDPAFDVSLDSYKRSNAFTAIGILFHAEISNFCRSTQGLSENRVRCIDERLDEFHSHECCSPANATGVPAAVGSSLKT